MRVLSKLEKNEFELTFNFLNYYVGMASYYGATKCSHIRIAGMFLNKEIFDFCDAIDKLQEFKEFGFSREQFKHLNCLQKINRIFNNCSEERKEIAIKRLIAYCFKKRVQPYKLRFPYEITDYQIIKEEEPKIFEYKEVA